MRGGAQRGVQRCAEVHRGAQRCVGFLLDNIFSLSVSILFEYPIKGESIILDYHLLLRFYTGRLYVWRGAWRCAEVCRGMHRGVCRGV